MSELILSPRAPFTVSFGGDTFLCYVYRPLDGLVTQSGASAEVLREHAKQMFAYLGAPILVVVGEPTEGAPVYRPSRAAIERLPAGDDAADPGVCVGHLIRSTVEATKQTSAATAADLDVLREEGHLVPEELHTTIGERSVWAVDGTDSVLVRCSRILASGLGEFSTHDLDGIDRDGSAKIAIRRARTALARLRPIDRSLVNGSVRPTDLEAARAVDPDLADRLLRHESYELQESP